MRKDKNKMKRFIPLVVIMCASLFLAPGLAPAVQPGETVPDFELPVYDSAQNFKLSDYTGKKGLVIAFVQSACTSCRAELQYFNSFVGTSDAYEIVAINVDLRSGRDSWKKAMAEVIKIEGYKMKIALDPKYTAPPVFGVLATPSSAVISKDGKLIGSTTGFGPDSAAEIQKYIGMIK